MAQEKIFSFFNAKPSSTFHNWSDLSSKRPFQILYWDNLLPFVWITYFIGTNFT